MKDYTHFFFNFAAQVLASIWKHSWRCTFSVLQLRLREMRFLNVEMRLLNVEIDEQISDKNWKHRHQMRISREHPSTLRMREIYFNIENAHFCTCFQIKANTTSNHEAKPKRKDHRDFQKSCQNRRPKTVGFFWSTVLENFLETSAIFSVGFRLINYNRENIQ